MSQFLEFLRPHPHRGDIIAAGAVPLALAAIVIDLRMSQWPVGARFAVIALIAGLLLTMAWLAPLERETPRPYHSVLLVAALLPLIVALQLFAEVLGAHHAPGAGGSMWTFGAEALIAASLARAKNSAACTLIAALAGIIAVEAFINWAFRPHGLGAFRWFLVLLTLGLAGAAISLRDRRRRHSVQLINAAGLATLLIPLTFLLQAVIADAAAGLGAGSLVDGAGAGASFGWKLWVLAIGFGLVGYSAVDYEPGPGYIGTLVLAGFAALVSLGPGGGSLLGWPLFLLVIGGAGLVIGLRPRQPLPEQPGPVATASTVPLREEEVDG